MRHVVLALMTTATTALTAQRPIPITIETSLGTIEAQLDSAHAPVTVTNFLRYLDAHMLDSGAFFRSVRLDNQPDNAVKIEVIQSRAGASARGKEFPPIPLERTNATGLLHHDGVLSMARSGPNTATDQFFITIGEQPELDFGGKRNADGQGFAAFGKVTKGMDVVRKIQAGAVTAQNLVTPVTIIRVARR
jgi:peptidyl-prolyl cis-trans isomerase A (cyclophilin A)